METAGRIQVAVDAVVFTIHNKGIKLLLIERKYAPFKGMFALPGGFVQQHENLEQAANRELQEETGVKHIFLHQLGAYGDVGRDPRGRVLSIAFIALISPTQELHATTDAAKAQWFPIDSLPKLAFDHEKIISDALERLRYEIQTTNVAFQILPERFTLTHLQNLYETILGKKLDKRNFRKRIQELHMLQETRETLMDGAHRPARLFRFRTNAYTPLKDRIQVFLK